MGGKKLEAHFTLAGGLLARGRSPYTFSPSFFLCRSVGRESDDGNVGIVRMRRERTGTGAGARIYACLEQ